MPCHANSLQLCPALQDPMDCSPLGFSVHGFLQARRAELPCPPPGDLPNSGIKLASLMSPAVAVRIFTSALGSPRFATPTNKILLIIPQVKLIRKKSNKNMICHHISSHPIFREKYLKHPNY